MEKILVATITIPRYRRTFITSESINAKYFEKGRGKKLPLAYCDKVIYEDQGIREPDGVNYYWKEFACQRQMVKKMVDFLVDSTGKRVVSNPNKIGKTNEMPINGEKIYNGFVGKHTRNKMIGAIKDQFRQFTMAHPEIKQYPLIIECELYDLLIDPLLRDQKWDVGNRVLPYNKAFEDVLKDKDLKTIYDDSVWYVTGAPGGLFTPVETTEERKLVYKIYVDRRPVIVNNLLYQNELKEALK